ncbi:MAG: small multi-drug export protein [Clostridia bacterium]|nr:small multi-drug export protein [Clostridia bacterium]
MINYLMEFWQELLVVFGISMVPVIELRGAIPVAIAYDIPWQLAYVLCVAGNIFPVPFIIAYMKPVFGFIRRSKLFVKFIDWMERRTMKKAETVLKYSGIALFVFVAIPAPGTGAWTGAMIAAILGMRMKYSIPWITLGVAVAGIVVTFLSYHLI